MAARCGMTLTRLVEESLREKLDRQAESAARSRRVELPTSGHGGTRPGVNINDSKSLWDLLDEDVHAVRPGRRHWGISTRPCRETGARGPLVPEAYFAALAIEHRCEWVTCDSDYARFERLRWRRPFA